MAFKTAKRLDDVAPISAQQAKFASSASQTSELDEKHAAAMVRAGKTKGNEITDVGSKEIPAKYKIEVFFGPRRTHNGPNVVKVQFWESGRRLHGGGDDLMYICRDVKDESKGCGKIFTSDCVKGPMAICPKCQRAVNPNRCTRALVGNKSTRLLAKQLAEFWRQLEGNADIYCKFDRDDVRYLAIEKQLGSKEARRLRGLSIYPLKNILTDTASGTPVEEQFFKYLTA